MPTVWRTSSRERRRPHDQIIAIIELTNRAGVSVRTLGPLNGGTGMRGISIRRAVGLELTSAAAFAVGATGAYGASPFEIAFEVDGHGEQTWVVKSNGAGRQDLGAGGQPLVSPNGQMVAASNLGSRGHALIVYSTVGEPKQL